jgi:1-acyl-sn-glycerol-3-phosphate acyltransferase
MKWLSKDGIFKIPIMGWMMRMAGDIEVQRGSATSRMQSLAGIRDRLDKNVSVMIMPEGTRSRTGELLPFRDGAFRVAIEKQLPVLPISVAGTRNCMAPGTFRFQRARAEARVLPPIETTGMTMADVEDLKNRVREQIAATRAELLRELA